MWPAGWKNKYSKVGGGDIPFTDIRYFIYRFSDSIWERFKSLTHVELEFDSNINFDSNENWVLKKALDGAPFFIRGVDIMEWARENISTGRAIFEFRVDGSLETKMEKGRSEKILRASFSKKSHALLFKLTFGGK